MAPEAVALADAFLPAAAIEFGHPSKRRSHRLYWVKKTLPKTRKFTDTDGSTLVELRSTGTQTLWPGSTHPSGELIMFDNFGRNNHTDEALVDGKELADSLSLLAACAVLTQHWPGREAKGNRHDIANAVGGFLLRQAVDEQKVVKLVEEAARTAGDEEWRERGKDVHFTAKALADGKPVTGGRRLAELPGGAVVSKLSDFLNLRQSSEEDTKKKEPTQASILIEIAENTELFHTEEDEAYVTFKVSDHRDTCRAKSTRFRRYQPGGSNGITIPPQGDVETPRARRHLRRPGHGAA